MGWGTCPLSWRGLGVPADTLPRVEQGQCQKEPFYFQAPVRAVWESPGPTRPLGEKAVCPLWSGCRLWEGLDRWREQKRPPGRGSCRHKGLGPPPSPSAATSTTTVPARAISLPGELLHGLRPVQLSHLLQEAQASVHPRYRWGNRLTQLKGLSQGHTAKSRDSNQGARARVLGGDAGLPPGLASLGPLPSSLGAGVGERCRRPWRSRPGAGGRPQTSQAIPAHPGSFWGPAQHLLSLVLTAWLPVPTMSLVKLQTRFPVAQNWAMFSGISLGRGQMEGLYSQHQDAAFTEVPMATWKHLWLSADSLLGESSRGGITASRAGRHLFELLVLIDDNNNRRASTSF